MGMHEPHGNRQIGVLFRLDERHLMVVPVNGHFAVERQSGNRYRVQPVVAAGSIRQGRQNGTGGQKARKNGHACKAV